MITKLQKFCLLVFVLFNIFDTLATTWGVLYLGGQEWSLFLRHFSFDPVVFVTMMILIKCLSIYFFYKVILILNDYDSDHPEISWKAAGNWAAAGVLSIFPVWMVVMVFLNWKG